MVSESAIFDRDTRIVVGDLEVSELRVAFRVAKDVTQDPNSTELAVFNLSESNRARISEYNAEMGDNRICLLYTSDAADDMQCVDLGGRRIIKKKK